MAQQVETRNGAKKYRSKCPNFEFNFMQREHSMKQGKTFIVPYLHNRDKNPLDFTYHLSWKYLCTIVSFSKASFLIDLLQGVKVSSPKLKKIFYKNKTLPIIESGS